jgi:GntR family transcriptional repressor for pyruvate dehydrogenase complex
MAQAGQDTVVDRNLAAFKPIRQRTAADEVVAVLVDAIRGGLYRPGDLLPRERDLAERLEVSRTVVREAIGVLRGAGVVTTRRGRSGGVVVVSLANLSQVVAQLGGEMHSTLQAVLEARRPLEHAAALLASQRATADDIARLHGLVDQLESLTDSPDEFLAVDVHFHIAISEVSRSPLLQTLVRSVMEQHLMALLDHFPVGRVDLGDALVNQRATLDAIESRDPRRVTAAIDEHLATLEEQFLGHRLSHLSTPPR